MTYPLFFTRSNVELYVGLYYFFINSDILFWSEGFPSATEQDISTQNVQIKTMNTFPTIIIVMPDIFLIIFHLKSELSLYNISDDLLT